MTANACNNDPKGSICYRGQDGSVWFDYDGGSNKLTINPRIIEMINARIGAEYIDWDQYTGTEHIEKRMHWNDTDEMLEIDLAGGNVSQQIGGELFVPRRVINKTESDMSNGDIVYISGGSGANAYITLASSDTYATGSRTIAMLTEDIAKNSRGWATTFGLVRQLNTDGCEPGTRLYLSESGQFTDTRPEHPNMQVCIGTCFRQSATEGIVLVHIDNPVTAASVAGGGDTVWIDENFDSISTAQGSSKPDLITFKDTNILVAALDGAGTLEELNSWREYQHDGFQGSGDTSATIDFHAHVGATDANSGDVKLSVEVYIGDSTGGELYSDIISNVQSDIADGTAWVDKVFTFPDIHIDNIGIGSQIGARLFRDPQDASDTYGSDIFIKTWGYHYKVDSLGSRQKFNKG